MAASPFISPPAGIRPLLSPGVRRVQRLISAVGIVMLALAAAAWRSDDHLMFLGFLVMSVLSAGVRLTRIDKQRAEYLPLNFVFLAFATTQLSPSETIVLAAITGIACRLWNGTDGDIEGVIFESCHLLLATAVLGRVFHSMLLEAYLVPVRLLLGAFAMFLVRSLPVALSTARARGEGFLHVWAGQCYWALPHYLLGALVASGMAYLSGSLGWQTVLLACPVLYLLFRSYRLYLERVDDERRRTKEISTLHLRTIEALALAIDAKDQGSNSKLHRVQIFAEGMAEKMGLSSEEKQALHTAALLHDIGKLAVPEHIISKPSRLTAEEFEKVKIHPVVGAEILDGVQFPYPVVPIVRAHHEHWNGSGYPYGLAGENIPLGARILAVVDCFDALVSDRNYRRAMTVPEAMDVIRGESGKAYDPKVVEALEAGYEKWEEKARALDPTLATVADPEAAPSYPQKNPEKDFLTSIAAARHEVQALFEISQDLGSSLSLEETLSVLGVRLRKLVPHHTLAIWVRREGVLMPECITGEDLRLLSSLQIPLGHGVAGWVAQTGKPIVNGNPATESTYLNDPARVSYLRSTIAVPLTGTAGVIGVLSLYHEDRNAFSKDHLRILLGMSSKVGASIENLLRFRQVESSATTDFLTGLPNSRSLFLQLDTELARSRREERSLAVIVLDLDGFKQVNDRLGHLEGNQLLRAVGTALKRACREYDYVARMGGDEFVMLMPGVQSQDVDQKISQFREVIIRASQEAIPGSNVSASAGVTIYPRDGVDAETLLAEADRRMYQEKRYRKSGAVGTRPFLIRSTKGRQGA